jgi:radical SAM protein with 4Fe4S-binding SPASM domain
MDEQLTKQENLERIRYLQRLFVNQRTPASGSINLTDRCNLNCIHCYLGKRRSEAKLQNNELNSKQWFSIIDQITEAGCLYLLLTGGEVFLRSDFGAIYRKAVTSGMLVTVFTNGTLINKSILTLFDEFPPRAIEITLYGATAQTYENITGIKGSFKQCLDGIKGLHERGFKLKLKTMMLSQNSSELAEIEKIAIDYGVDFRMDAAISPCLDGDRKPLYCRIKPTEAVKADFANQERASRWSDFYKKNYNLPPKNDFLYNCGAGLTNFHISSDGILSPCMMLKKPTVDLKNIPFIDGWKNKILELRKIKVNDAYKCNHCELRRLCSNCPAFFELENGSPEVHSKYLCKLAETRLETITANLAVEEKIYN